MSASVQRRIARLDRRSYDLRRIRRTPHHGKRSKRPLIRVREDFADGIQGTPATHRFRSPSTNTTA